MRLQFYQSKQLRFALYLLLAQVATPCIVLVTLNPFVSGIVQILVNWLMRFLIAIGIGLILGRWWALFLAILPLPLQAIFRSALSVIFYGNTSRGERSLDILIALGAIETMVWFVGIAIGVFLHGKTRAGHGGPDESSLEHSSP